MSEIPASSSRSRSTRCTGCTRPHQLQDEDGAPLELVHRDVTPGNVVVGVDGSARIADFGVAKARARITKTNPGIVKGKAGYIAPEVVLGHEIDGRADVFSMGVMLWNALTGKDLFDTDDLASSLTSLLKSDVPPPSTVGLQPPPIFDAPILGALHREPKLRHRNALEFAHALTDAMDLAGMRVERERIGQWVYATFGPQLKKRRQYAGLESEPWDAETTEPPSTSRMVKKDPTGRIVTAMPEPEEGTDAFAATVASGVPDFVDALSDHDTGEIDALRANLPKAPITAAPFGEDEATAMHNPRRKLKMPDRIDPLSAEEAELDRPRSSGGAWNIVIGAIVLLAIAGAAYWFITYRPAAPVTEPEEPVLSEPTEEASEVEPASPGADAIEEEAAEADPRSPTEAEATTETEPSPRRRARRRAARSPAAIADPEEEEVQAAQPPAEAEIGAEDSPTGTAEPAPEEPGEAPPEEAPETPAAPAESP